MTILIALLGLAALIISLTVHEYCHALSAHLLGDDTAERAGRLSLSPIPHIDPVGTLLLPLVASISGLPIIGWAKPVPVNPYNLRHGKWGQVIVALSGPGSNFALALLFLLVLKIVLVAGLAANNVLVLFLILLVMVNVLLGLFNFLPFHPLDGSQLVSALLDSPKYHRLRLFLETRGPMILLGVILLDFISPVPFLSAFFGTVVNGVFKLGGIPPLF